MNFAHVAEGAPTRVKHFGLYRCSVDEVRTMQPPLSQAAQDLVAAKLTALQG